MKNLKKFKISFVTMSGRTIEKTVKALDYESAHQKLEHKYNIAYFNDCEEITENNNFETV